MKRIFLLRHGPTHAKAMTGWTDLPADLSDTALLERIDRHLPHAPVVSSDLTRAITTADAIQGNRPRLPHDPALREIHFGDWEGKTWAEVNAATPDLIRQFWENPGDTHPPGGESWHMILARVTRAIDRLLADHDTLIIAAHFGAIISHLQHAGGWTTEQAFSHKIDPLSLSETWRDTDGWHVGKFNRMV